MNSVLITGANGFIGRRLCEKMLTGGWRVRGTVRTAETIRSIPEGVEIRRMGSIGPDTDWTEALKSVETVVHLAARVHMMKDTASDSLERFRHVNVAGTERLANAAAVAGCRRFVYMSSIKVNGEERGEPYTEKDAPLPQDPYGASKWETEQILHQISDKTGIEVVVLRPPLVYGPGVKANFLRLLKAVDRGLPFPFARVNNRRSLIYVKNLIDAVFTSISCSEAAGQTYLLSDGDDVSTPELIRRIGSALGCPVRLFPFPLLFIQMIGKIFGKSAAVERLLGSLTVDCSKIKRELDWKPPYTMDQGLRETAEWYLKRRNISRKGAKTLR